MLLIYYCGIATSQILSSKLFGTTTNLSPTKLNIVWLILLAHAINRNHNSARSAQWVSAKQTLILCTLQN